MRRRSSTKASASTRPRCRRASCGTKYDSSGTASSAFRSSITRSNVVPERRTPRTITGVAAGIAGSLGTTTMLYEMKRAPRRADPYRDTEVIDERAPRFNQVVVGLVSLLAVVTGWWWLLALLALQLALGLTLGRRWCLACVFYFEVLQPRFGEGRLEDARPPRFANMVGLGVLGTASLAYALGLETLGAALGLLVAALALLAATTGFCAGCTAYKVGYRLTGRRF